MAEDLPVVLGKISELGVSIAGSSGRKVRVYLLENDPRSDDIVAMPEVAAMEEFIPPKLHNDVARQLMGLDPKPNAGLNPGFKLTGEGQIVGLLILA
jgi:hypothetical protein